jgi:transposase-like protein
MAGAGKQIEECHLGLSVRKGPRVAGLLIPQFDGEILSKEWQGSTARQVRHGSATTTQAVRAAILRSQASLAQLSQELGINPKTVAKWRKRALVDDLKTGPSDPRLTVLTEPSQLVSKWSHR